MTKAKIVKDMTREELIEAIVWMERMVYRYGTLGKDTPREPQDFSPKQYSKEKLLNEYLQYRDYCEDRFL